MDRTLTRDNLVIADGAHPVALAGVMGGEESEISPSTRAVLLESAWFEPVSIRRTSKSQGMHTEASHRFERGADIQMAPLALDRTAALIQEIAGGEILAGMIDVYPRPWQPRGFEAWRGARLRAFWEQKSLEKKLSASCAAWDFRSNERTAKAGEFPCHRSGWMFPGKWIWWKKSRATWAMTACRPECGPHRHASRGTRLATRS